MTTDAQPAKTVLYLSRTGSDPTGFGGKRRGYQICHDLESVPGVRAVVTASVPAQALASASVEGPLGRLARRTRRLLRNLSRRPRLAFESFVPRDFWREYEAQVRSLTPPVIGVIDDARLEYGQVVNERHGIPTVYCCHNLQSLHGFDLRRAGRLEGLALGLDLGLEMNAFARGRSVLLISRVEVSLLQGLGLNPLFYGYRPVGRIREQLLRIRQLRAEAGSDQGYFVLMGNAVQPSTEDALEWFLRNVEAHGLPPGVSIIGIGKRLRAVHERHALPAAMECRDWVDESAFESLIVGARGVLIPHFRGFGSLTRLSEMACAGVPVVTTPHAVLTMDRPPGIRLADVDWSSWLSEMERLQATAVDMPLADYLEWEGRQANPVRAVVGELLTE